MPPVKDLMPATPGLTSTAPAGATSPGASPGASLGGSRVAGANGAAGAAANPRAGHDARLKDAARQFEAVFMTEMLRHARPSPKASGAFAPGQSEETWRVMMDQALGQAATTGGPAGDGSLRKAIEKALRDADAPRGKEK